MTPLTLAQSLAWNLTCSRCGQGAKPLYRATGLARQEDGVCRPCAIVLELPVIRSMVRTGHLSKEHAARLVAKL